MIIDAQHEDDDDRQGEAIASQATIDSAGTPGGSPRWFLIEPASLTCPGAYPPPGADSPDRNSVIEYDAGRHADLAEPVLFYGPYVDLEPGVYLFTFAGHLEGVMVISFAHGFGQPIKEVSIETFADPICLVATKPLSAFEVRGRKTPMLRFMRLESIAVDRVHSGMKS